jgi:quinol monooxygenase YgiN
MSAIQVTARMKIHDGKLAEFKEAAELCMKSVRENDSGTLQYDWFLNKDETECVVRETYRDSDALLEHVGNLGDAGGALVATCSMELEMFGAPSEQLVAATERMRPKIYSPLLSM